MTKTLLVNQYRHVRRMQQDRDKEDREINKTIRQLYDRKYKLQDNRREGAPVEKEMRDELKQVTAKIFELETKRSEMQSKLNWETETKILDFLNGKIKTLEIEAE